MNKLLKFEHSGNLIFIYTDTIFKYEEADDNKTNIFCTPDPDHPYNLPVNAEQLINEIHRDEEFRIRY